MGAGGYRSAEPKWDKVEADMREKGIAPATEEWPHRVRNWVLGHGAQYDVETWELIVDEKKEISKPQKANVEAVKEVREGKFIPDREHDELTKALGNPEKGGRTREIGRAHV